MCADRIELKSVENNEINAINLIYLSTKIIDINLFKEFSTRILNKERFYALIVQNINLRN